LLRKARKPESAYGRWFAAVILNRQAQARELGSRLGQLIPVGGWEQERIAAIVFERLVREAFSPACDVRDISKFVDEILVRMTNPGLVGRLEAEALIRSALGEEAVSTSGIDLGQAGSIRTAVSMTLINAMRLSSGHVERRVREAEQAAETEGVVLILE
jgi:hypothetical protein